MKKAKHPEHVNHERWLVSYADFITLLFAFFVVLFSTAPKDDKNSRKITTVTQTAFSRLSIFGPGGDTVLKEQKMKADDEGAPLSDRRQENPGKFFTKVVNHGPDRSKNMTTSDENYKPHLGMRDTMTQEFYKGLVDQGMSASLEARGLVVSFTDAALFKPGSAEITPEAEKLITKVMDSIKNRKNLIQVEGHSDGTDADKGSYGSFLAISNDRALKIAEYLMTHYQIPMESIATAGFGNARPLASNDDEAGRQKNRRVDIVLMQTTPDASNIAMPSFKKEENGEPIATDEILH